MKSRLITTLCVVLVVLACNKQNSTVTPIPQSSMSSHAAYKLSEDFQDSASSRFIPLDSANKMIGSYLNSINASSNDSDVRSFTVNADSLRAYLADGSIKNIKLVFAHTMKYINAGNAGVYAGLQSGAITIIIGGYDVNGDYVFHGQQVLDHLTPCPYTCPSGSAAQPTFN